MLHLLLFANGTKTRYLKEKFVKYDQNFGLNIPKMNKYYQQSV